MRQRARKVVVTGGAGFIGSHLVDRLLEDGEDQVIALDNLSRGTLQNLAHLKHESRFELIEADLRDGSAVTSALHGASVVYHLAAQSTLVGAAREMEFTFETNVKGTFNVLRAASAAGVQRMLFASSREVYGEPITLPVDEDSPLLPVNWYGASKVAGEAYCRAFRREVGLQTIILRFANIYGPRDTGRVVPNWLHQATSGQELRVYGGKQIVDFLWIGAAVEALARAGSLDGPVPPINIGSGTGTRIIDLARRIVRLAERSPKIRVEPARPADVTRFIANVDRMRQILSIEPPLDPLDNLVELVTPPVLALT